MINQVEKGDFSEIQRNNNEMDQSIYQFKDEENEQLMNGILEENKRLREENQKLRIQGLYQDEDPQYQQQDDEQEKNIVYEFEKNQKQNLQKLKKELLQFNEMIEKQLQDSEAEFQSFYQSQRELKSEKQKFYSELEVQKNLNRELIQQINKKEEVIQQKEEQTVKQLKRIQEMAQKNLHLHEQRENFKNQTQKLEQSILEMQNDLNKKNKIAEKLDEYQKINGKSLEQIENLKQQIQQQEIKLQQFEFELKEKNQTITKLEESINTNKQDFQKREDVLIQKNKNLAIQNESLINQQNKLQISFEKENQKDKDSFQQPNENDQGYIDVGDFLDQIEQLNKTLKHKQKKIEILEESLKNLELEAEEKNEKAGLEIKSIQTQLQQSINTIENLSEVKKDLEIQNQLINQTIVEYKNNYDQLQKQFKEITQEFNNLYEKHNKLNEEDLMSLIVEKCQMQLYQYPKGIFQQKPTLNQLIKEKIETLLKSISRTLSNQGYKFKYNVE